MTALRDPHLYRPRPAQENCIVGHNHWVLMLLSLEQSGSFLFYQKGPSFGAKIGLAINRFLNILNEF